MSTKADRAMCKDQAQYSRLQGLFQYLDRVAPDDIPAVLRKCTAVLSEDLDSGRLVLISAEDLADLEMAASPVMPDDHPVSIRNLR